MIAFERIGKRIARILIGAVLMWLFMFITNGCFDHIVANTKSEWQVRYFEFCRAFPYAFAAFVMAMMAFGKMPETKMEP